MVEPAENGTSATSTFDELLPAEMAAKAQSLGLKKANMDFLSTFALAIMAGAFIALGAIFFTISQTTIPGATATLPWGVMRVIGGLTFSLGLILVIVGGAELFTGNNLIIMAWASRQLSTWKVLSNWGIVFIGNLCGAVATALVVFAGKHYTFASDGVGLAALNIGNTKVNYDFWQALILGILCNALVCLAVWLTYSARTVMGRIMAIVFPITAFVAAGFEHNVANMYFIPFSILVKAGAPESFWTAIGKTAGDYGNLTWGHFVVNNLIPVTIGNIIGGVFFVALVYWVIYLRKPPVKKL
jgi:formate transporter